MNKVKLQQSSENVVASCHILRFVLDRDVNVINATVQASLRDTSCKVQASKTSQVNV